MGLGELVSLHLYQYNKPIRGISVEAIVRDFVPAWHPGCGEKKISPNHPKCNGILSHMLANRTPQRAKQPLTHRSHKKGIPIPPAHTQALAGLAAPNTSSSPQNWWGPATHVATTLAQVVCGIMRQAADFCAKFAISTENRP